MSIREFQLERYFARWEFNAPYLLSASDCDLNFVQNTPGSILLMQNGRGSIFQMQNKGVSIPKIALNRPTTPWHRVLTLTI
jgi:hypothetical protein